MADYLLFTVLAHAYRRSVSSVLAQGADASPVCRERRMMSKTAAYAAVSTAGTVLRFHRRRG